MPYAIARFVERCLVMPIVYPVTLILVPWAPLRASRVVREHTVVMPVFAMPTLVVLTLPVRTKMCPVRYAAAGQRALFAVVARLNLGHALGILMCMARMSS